MRLRLMGSHDLVRAWAKRLQSMGFTGSEKQARDPHLLRWYGDIDDRRAAMEVRQMDLPFADTEPAPEPSPWSEMERAITRAMGKIQQTSLLEPGGIGRVLTEAAKVKPIPFGRCGACGHDHHAMTCFVKRETPSGRSVRCKCRKWEPVSDNKDKRKGKP